MHTILIKHRPKRNVAPICSCFIRNNAAADRLSMFGSYYDTNVDGWGSEMNINQFLSKSAPYPELSEAIISAVKEGQHELAEASDGCAKFIQDFGPQVYHLGLRFEIDGQALSAPVQNPVAVIDGVQYASLSDAINASADNAVITLTSDAVDAGTQVKENTSVTVDLAGHAFLLEEPMTGSAGTATNGFQLLKGSDVTFKNGTITSAQAKILVQNYANLTLDNVKLIGSPTNQYVLSNNFGKIILKNGTQIKAADGTVAFDAYYGMFSAYDAGVTVEIADNSVVISGKIEFGKAARASEENFKANAHIIIPAGYSLDAPEGFEWVPTEDGKQELSRIQ